MRIVSGGTWLAQDCHQWGLGEPKCLEQSRHMLVLLGPFVSHTISTSEVLVRENASITFGSCPVLMGHLLRKALATVKPWCPCRVLLGALGWHNIGTIVALVCQGASDSLGSCL